MRQSRIVRFVSWLVLFALISCEACETQPGLRHHTHTAAGDPALPGITNVDAELALRLAATEGASEARFTNRLALEASPYLRQHAHNPVNWFPWGEEALERARTEDRPILLSIGYSTCHWCHVMARESFEDEEIARVINERFVAIKIDREERPDLDERFMRAVIAISGRGGWPMTIVLTSDAQPFFAGTYFPPRAGPGARIGMLEILTELSAEYETNRAAIVREASERSVRLATQAEPLPAAPIPDAAVLTHAVTTLAHAYDAEWGGFGDAPKFVQPPRLAFLLEEAQRIGDTATLAMVTHTLDRVIDGGIHDHVGGGFHRYSTDAHWEVPHFEKMLYDNAQLASLLTETWQASGDDRYRAVATETLDYLVREMRHADGGFFSATDADSETPEGEVEGAYFTWTRAELAAVLDPGAAEGVASSYGVTDERSVLHLVAPSEAIDLSMLRAARDRRPRPSRDEKVQAGWNGLAISAFARAGFAMHEDRFVDIASTTFEFVWAHMRDSSGALMHEWIDGTASGDAFLDDYAALLVAALDLFDATSDPRWLDRARELASGLDAHFTTTRDGPLRLGSADSPIVYDDGVMPSGNALAVMGLLRLAEVTDDAETRARAERLLSALSTPMQHEPTAMPYALLALSRHLASPREVAIVSPAGSDAEALIAVLRRTRVPNTHVITTDVDALVTRVPWLAGKVAIDDRPTAFVCERGRCELPTSNPVQLAAQLAQ